MAQQYPPPGYYYPTPVLCPASTSGWAVFRSDRRHPGLAGSIWPGRHRGDYQRLHAKNEITNSGGRVGGNGMATTGLVLGWLNIAVACLGAWRCYYVIYRGVGYASFPARDFPQRSAKQLELFK